MDLYLHNIETIRLKDPHLLNQTGSYSRILEFKTTTGEVLEINMFATKVERLTIQKGLDNAS